MSIVVRRLIVYALVGALTAAIPPETACADEDQIRPDHRETSLRRSIREAVDEVGVAEEPRGPSRTERFNAGLLQGSSPLRKSKKGALVMTLVGLGMMAGGGALMAAYKKPAESNCETPGGGQQYINCYPDLSQAFSGPTLRDAGMAWLVVGAAMTTVGLIRLR